MTARPWLWPDHAIGKRESSRLREEHNEAVNLLADLLAACEQAVKWMSVGVSEDHAGIRVLCAAIRKARGTP